MIRFLTVGTMLLAGLAGGQTVKFPIVSLEVEGNKHFSGERILAVTGLKLGQAVVQQEFEAARDRLVASGFFESVGYQYKPSADKAGYAASFQVVEVQQSYIVTFDRLNKNEKELKAALAKADPLFGEKVPGTATVLARYAKVLEGVVGEKVVGRVMPDSADLKIVFQPERMPPSIAEVAFLKNEVLPQAALQKAIAGSAIGTVWEEKKFAQMLEAGVRPLYEARGRLRMKIVKVTTAPVADVNGIKVTVELDEGEVFNLGKIEVEAEGASVRELLKAGDLKSGDTANFDDITAGVERMRQVVRRTGYLQAKAAVERKLDDAKKEVNLVVRIEPGKRYTFRKLHIAGLDILSEPPIRKAWGMKEGQPFNPEYADGFLNQLREEGVFDNLGKTKAEIKTDDEMGMAEVTLRFYPAEREVKKDAFGRPVKEPEFF